MSPVSTQYSAAMSALDVLTKGNPSIVAALPLAVLATAAGLSVATWGGPAAGLAIAASIRTGSQE